MTFGGAPPGVTDCFAGFATISTSAGRSSPRRNVSDPGPSSRRPAIRISSDVRKSTHSVLTGSPLLQVVDPSTSHTGPIPTIGATTPGKRSCVGLGWHGPGSPVPDNGLYRLALPAAARDSVSSNEDIITPALQATSLTPSSRAAYSVRNMAMGKRKRDRQVPIRVTTTDLPTAASHRFYIDTSRGESDCGIHSPQPGVRMAR